MNSQNHGGHRSHSPTFAFGLSNAIAAEASAAAASFSFGFSHETADVPPFSFASVDVPPPSAVHEGQQDAKAADAASGDGASTTDTGANRDSAQDSVADEPPKAKKRRVDADSSLESSQDRQSENKQMVAPSSEFGVGMLELMRSVCGASPFGCTVYNGLQQVMQTMATRLGDADQKAWEQAFAKQFARPAWVSMWQSGKIPDVALQNIMSFLTPSTLLKVWELVCRRWRGVSLSGWTDYHEIHNNGRESCGYNNWKNAPLPGEQQRLGVMDSTWSSAYRLQKLQTRIAGKVQRFSIRLPQGSYVETRVMDTLQGIDHYLSRVREFHYSTAGLSPAEATTLKFCIEHMPQCHTLQISNGDSQMDAFVYSEPTLWTELLTIIRRSPVCHLTIVDFPTVPVHECFRIRASEPPTRLTHVAFLTTRSVAHQRRYSIRTKAWRHVLDDKSDWEPCKTIRSIRIVLADGRVHPFFIFIGYNCPNLTDLDLQCGGFRCDSLKRDYKKLLVKPASSFDLAFTYSTGSTTATPHASQPTTVTSVASSTHSSPKKTHVLQYQFQHLRISSFTKQAFGRADTGIDYGVPAYDPRQFFWMIGMRCINEVRASGDGSDVDSSLLSTRGAAGQGDKDGAMSLDSGSSVSSAGSGDGAAAAAGATSSSAPLTDNLSDTSDTNSVEDGNNDDNESDSDDETKDNGKGHSDINHFTNLLHSQLRTVQLDVPIHLPRNSIPGRFSHHTAVTLDDFGMFIAPPPPPATVDAHAVDAKRPGCELCYSTADERHTYSTSVFLITQEQQSLEDRCIRGWNSLQDVELNMVISNHTHESVSSSSSYLDWSFAVDQMQRWSRLTRVHKLSLTIDKNVITQIDGAVIMTLQNFACIERVRELTIVGHGIAMPNMANLYRKLVSVQKLVSHKPPPRSQELIAAGTYMKHLTDWTWFTPRSLRECIPDMVDFLDRSKNYKPPLLKVLRLMLLVSEPPERTRTIGSAYLRQNITRTAHAIQATQINDMEQVKLQSAGMAAGVVIHVNIFDTNSSHVTSIV